MLRNKNWKPLAAAVVGTIVIALLLTMGDLMSITLMMAPFGASCVIVFVLPDSPLAKARNVVGGHLISTGAGLVMLHLFGDSTWIIALSVGLSILLMQLTRTVHPPAGADPLVVMLSHAGWSYLFTPVLFGAVLIALAAYGYRNLLATKSAALKS
ncbi:HPP family protein [Paenibacillus sp. FSL A5-0031]|uniref:HPP family protein n=1 Tax=Paenibacillus sp. FSL A5-0031 TaxID=1920420 RepID=UPI00096D11A7|nr:HPP family protein [Paenibacillus sp. FSL A5-0031]OME73489.1 HPP family protein [Paenibacillus sp. FSL A5-0031]